MKTFQLLLIFCSLFSGVHSQSISDDGRIYFKTKNVGSAKDITKGKIFILSIFASKGKSSWTEEGKKRMIDNQKRALFWISKEAFRYGKEVSFSHGVYSDGNIDFKLNSEVLIFSRNFIKSKRGNVNKEVLRALDSIGFHDTDSFIEFVKNKYNSTQVLVHLFVKGKGRSFAETFNTTSLKSKYLEIAVITERRTYGNQTQASVIAHETLHLFGAWDLYSPVSKDIHRENLAKRKFPKSVLLKSRENISDNVIDEVTAWRIGLIERKEWYLNFIPKHYFR